MEKLKVGDRIPKFKTVNQHDEPVSSGDLKGNKTVLFFYPKDDTPTCTKEACNLRDNHERLMAAGYTVYGISPDSSKRHRKFIEKHSLPYDLLVDEDHSMAEAFGVWGEKSMYGRTYMGILRTTFILNEKGVITEVIEKVKAAEHADQIL